MRENRVKQLASRIAGSALGLGGRWVEIERHRRGPDGKPEREADGSLKMRKRWVWQEDPSPKYAACHAVVIENLTNYRPEETRTRRENRQLMQWSSSKVKKYLSEACQLHGLHLREVQAGYTSRQDSRTGAPGMRCADVPISEFLNAPWWRKQVNAAKKKQNEKSGGTSRDSFLLELDAKWNGVTPDALAIAKPLRIPVNGGELFVSANKKSPAAKGLQADLNAAANIGLKALIDPDWEAKWWYIPCSAKDGKPLKEKVGGAACINATTSVFTPAAKSSEKKEIVNLWRDPATAAIQADDSKWYSAAKDYWNGVQCRVVNLLAPTKRFR